MATFTVPGEPTGKARPIVTKSGYAFTPQKTVLYENLIKTEFERQCGDVMYPKPTQIELEVFAYYSIPKSASKKKQKLMRQGVIRPIRKPDTDNILKVVADSLNKIAYDDDSQIVRCSIEKLYGEEPRIIVGVREWKYEESC